MKKIGALLLAFCLLCLAGCGVRGTALDESVDFSDPMQQFRVDYSKNVVLTRGMYTGFTVRVKDYKVISDADVEEYIASVLPNYKTYLTPTREGVAEEGDKVRLRFRILPCGADVSGLQNYGVDAAESDLGSGELHEEIETALRTATPASTALTEKSGADVTVPAGGLILITYDSTVEKGKTLQDGRYLSGKMALLDLTDPDVPAELAEALVGQKADGKQVTFTVKRPATEGTAEVTYRVSVSAVYEEQGLDVPVKLPENFVGSQSELAVLNGQTVTFRVIYLDYARGVVPEFDETFLREQLGQKDNPLHGDALIAEQKALLKKSLQQKQNTAAASAFWDAVLPGVTFRSLPGGLVRRYEEEYRAEVEETYANNAALPGFAYDNLQDFVRGYYGTDLTLDAYLRQWAEETVKRLVVTLVIADREDLYPQDFEALREEYVAHLAESTGKTTDEIWISYDDPQDLMRLALEEYLSIAVCDLFAENSTILPE